MSNYIKNMIVVEEDKIKYKILGLEHKFKEFDCKLFIPKKFIDVISHGNEIHNYLTPVLEKYNIGIELTNDIYYFENKFYYKNKEIDSIKAYEKYFMDEFDNNSENYELQVKADKLITIFINKFDVNNINIWNDVMKSHSLINKKLTDNNIDIDWIDIEFNDKKENIKILKIFNKFFSLFSNKFWS